MNKTELIGALAKAAGMTQKDVTKVVDIFIEIIGQALKKGDDVTLVGFGTFKVGNRAARTGRNPKTGDPIQIKASKTPQFKAGKTLKEAIV